MKKVDFKRGLARRSVVAGFTRTPKFGVTPKGGGFTLIELLVVVAIIGVLASVVLASLNSARAKGSDSAIKSNLANARAQAEMFYDSNSNKYYNGSAATDVCQNTSVGSPAIKSIYANVLAAANASSSTIVYNFLQTTTTTGCNSAAGTWVAQAPLKTLTGGVVTYWCVDWTGVSEAQPNALAAAATACP